MSLSDEQRKALEAEAERRGVDAGKLVAAAEAQVGVGSSDSTDPRAARAAVSAPKSTDKPLYMYHLPFVTVNEVRTIWLGLDPIAGGEEYAAKFAAAQTGARPSGTGPEGEPA